MRRDNINKWFETVLACSGSEYLEHLKQVNQDTDETFIDRFRDNSEYAEQAKEWQPLDDLFYEESFTDNFDQLYRPEIVSMVNRYIISDIREFYRLFDSFVTDIKVAFVLSDDLAGKRDLAEYITHELCIIKVAANRLANALRKKWNIADDPRYDRAIMSQQGNDSSSSFALLITGVQSQIRRQQIDNQSLNVDSPASLDRYNKPDQDYLYLSLLLARKTEECLVSTGWFKLYTGKPIKSNSDAQLPTSKPYSSISQTSFAEKNSTSSEGESTTSDTSSAVSLHHSLTDLFKSKTGLENATNILLKVSLEQNIRVISKDGKWIGNKGNGGMTVMIAWFNALEENGWFKIIISDNLLKAKMLNEHFTGLALSLKEGSLWGKYSDAATRCHADFMNLMA